MKQSKSGIIERIRAKMSPWTKRYVRKNVALVTRARAAMDAKQLNQAALADLIGSSEGEVSRFLTGNHNFTYKSIMKMEEALGVDLIIIPPADADRTYFAYVARIQGSETTRITAHETSGNASTEKKLEKEAA